MKVANVGPYAPPGGVEVECRALPNGALVSCTDQTRLWVWAMHFAHARAGMGVAIRIADGTVRVESVGAPRYCRGVWTVALAGDGLLDCGEQSPIRIAIEDCRRALASPQIDLRPWTEVAWALADAAVEAWKVGRFCLGGDS